MYVRTDPCIRVGDEVELNIMQKIAAAHMQLAEVPEEGTAEGTQADAVVAPMQAGPKLIRMNERQREEVHGSVPSPVPAPYVF